MQQPQQGYAVIQPQQIQSKQQTANDEYYYYYGGDEGQLTDITPTQQMVQQPQQIQQEEYKLDATLTSKLIEESLINQDSKPKSPLLLYNDTNNATYSLPIKNIDINCELHISTVFVSMKIDFENSSNLNNINSLFVFPCNGTITSTKVNIDNGKRYLDTTFIDNDSAKQFEQKKNTKQNEQNNGINRYIPNLFRLPIANIKQNEKLITINIDYIESLQFVEGRYHFYIPLNFLNYNILPKVNILSSINCLTPGIQYGSTTHNLILLGQENLRCKLSANCKQMNNYNNDFHLYYSCKTNAISAALLCDNGSKYEYDPSKSFVMFINPPIKIDNMFSRDIIFMLDRSGSMTGQPFNDAVKGISFALNTLTPNDRFTIIAFDHEEIYFNLEQNENENNNLSLKLYQAYPDTIQRGINFLNNLQARGMTDISKPLTKSINFLNQNCGNNIPFVFLLTDGCVENEKEIVKNIINLNENKTRILTFGIGPYCNEYFLKMLSLQSNGFNDGCIYTKNLYQKIEIMMNKARVPVLTNIKLNGIPQNCQIFPKTVPDLFLNSPIIISGQYNGDDMPKEVILSGTLQNGQLLQIPIRSDVSDIVPINKIFIKQRMDQLTSEYWLYGDEKIKKQIVDVSINEKFPSPYTSMVAYELTPKEKEENDKNNNNNDKNKKKKGGLSGGQIAALTGGAIVVGSGIFLLGNVAATMGNINIIDGLASGFGSIGDVFGDVFNSIINGCPCDSCIDIISCGQCDCGMIANVTSCGICADCDNCLDFIPCGDCDGGCIELPGCGAIGDVCDSCGGIIGDITDCNICGCFNGLPDCGDICDSCGGIIGGLTDCVDCGDICGCVAEIGGGLCEIFGDVFGSICDLF